MKEKIAFTSESSPKFHENSRMLPIVVNSAIFILSPQSQYAYLNSSSSYIDAIKSSTAIRPSILPDLIFLSAS